MCDSYHEVPPFKTTILGGGKDWMSIAFWDQIWVWLILAVGNLTVESSFFITQWGWQCRPQVKVKKANNIIGLEHLHSVWHRQGAQCSAQQSEMSLLEQYPLKHCLSAFANARHWILPCNCHMRFIQLEYFFKTVPGGAFKLEILWKQ